MTIEQKNLYAAGFLVGDILDSAGKHTRESVGTFFLVMVPSDRVEGYRHPYMVAPRHVTQQQPDLEAKIRAP